MTQINDSPGRRLMARLDEFAAFTDDPPKLTRLYLSDAHRRAAAQFIAAAPVRSINASARGGSLWVDGVEEA